MKNKKTIIAIVVVILLIAGTVWLAKMPRTPGKYDTFASCLGEKGAKFYGAFWCPHCRNQKAVFGKSATLLPYIECSTPDGKGRTPVCAEAKIEGYPTWEFADGERLSGEVALATLAEKTSCELPQ